jgi:hypothetical protein
MDVVVVMEVMEVMVVVFGFIYFWLHTSQITYFLYGELKQDVIRKDNHGWPLSSVILVVYIHVHYSIYDLYL